MVYHIIYDRESGEIHQVYSVYDGGTGTFVKLGRDEVLSNLSDFFPDPEKVDVLAIDTMVPIELHRTRVNPTEKRLEPSEEE